MLMGRRPMKSHIRNLALGGVALGLLAGLHAVPARADDTAAEIRALKAKLKELEQRVAQQGKQIRGVAKVPPMPPGEPPLVCKDQDCPPPPPPVFVSFTNGLKVESWDHDFSFKIGGRIIVDGGVNSQPVEAFPQPYPPFPAAWAPYYPAHAGSGYSNQVGLRQARLQVEGTAFRWWDYKLQYDFAGSSNDLIVGGIRDAYLAWRHFAPLATFQVGNMYEPFGLERINSFLYVDFIERALASDLLSPSRHLGFAAATGGAAPGLYGDPNWSLKGGIFSTSLEDGAPLGAITSAAPNLATSGIPAGNSGFLAPVAGGHQYWEATGRLTYAPILTPESLLHVGGEVRYQKPNDATATSDDRVLQPGPSLRSEANILSEQLLGTQPLTCVVATAQLPGQNCVKDVVNYGAELVASYGPFSLQAEYRGMHYDRDGARLAFFNSFGNHAPGGTSVNFNGFYAYVTWYLTGESRASAYKTYPEEYAAPSTFGQIKILHPVSSGGWGAWEVAARVSEINLNDGHIGFFQPLGIGGLGVNQNIQGGRQSDFTLGLNWYPDPGIRFMANWVDVFQYSANYNRPDLKGIHPQLFELRAQVSW
jgi:phosphate-selective porin OprO and OprP